MDNNACYYTPAFGGDESTVNAMTKELEETIQD